MAIDLGGTVNGDNIRLEPMLAYFGNRNRDCITAVAVASLTQGDYFDFETTDFDGTISEYRVWYDIDAAGTGTPSADGRTLIEVDVLTGDLASDVASKTVAQLALSASEAS